MALRETVVAATGYFGLAFLVLTQSGPNQEEQVRLIRLVIFFFGCPFLT